MLATFARGPAATVASISIDAPLALIGIALLACKLRHS